MATAAPFVKLLRQLTAARDDYRSGALELSWDGGKANIYFVFGQPNHAIFQEGEQHLEGQEAVAALLTKLPRKFTVAPWRKTVVREETLKITMDELMEPFAQLAGEAPAEELPPAAVPPAVGGDTVGTGFEFEFDFGLDDFPLLPMGETVWSDAAINVVHLDLLIPKLPTSLIVLTGPHLRAAAVTLNGQLIDAVWLDGEVRSTGEAAAMSLMAAREGTMSCYRLENSKLVEAITMLWRCPARYRDMSVGWLNVDAFIDAVMRERLDCVLRVVGKELGFGFFMGGQLVAAYSESSRVPTPDMALLRALFDSPNASVTVLQRATDRALGTSVREEAFHASAEGAAIPAPTFAAGMAAITPEVEEPPAPAAATGAASWASKVTVTERDTDIHKAPPIAADMPAPPPGTEEEEEEEPEAVEAQAETEPVEAQAEPEPVEAQTEPEVPPAEVPEAPAAAEEPPVAAEAEIAPAEAPEAEPAAMSEAPAAAAPSWEAVGEEEAFPNAPMWGSASPPTEPGRWEAPAASADEAPAAGWSEAADQEQWAAAPTEEHVETGAGQPTTPEVGEQQPAAEAQPWQEQPGAEEPLWQQPAAEEQQWQQPAAQEPQWQQPAPEEPQWQQPAAQEPQWQQPAPEEPQWQQPAAEESQWQQPAAEEPQWQQPGAEEPQWEQAPAAAAWPPAEPAQPGWEQPAAQTAAWPPAAEAQQPAADQWQASAADAWATTDQPAPAAGGWLEKPPIPGDAAATTPAWQSPAPNATAAEEEEDDYPSPGDLDFDGIKNDLVQIGVLWLGSDDVGPVREMILNTKPSVDDFVATIDAIKSISISGHDPSVIRAMAREMHYHAAEYLSGA